MRKTEIKYLQRSLRINDSINLHLYNTNLRAVSPTALKYWRVKNFQKKY